MISDLTCTQISLCICLTLNDSLERLHFISTDSKSKYGLENDLDIGNVLKEQGVRIDDLMALRDSLMKGDNILLRTHYKQNRNIFFLKN